MTRKLSITSLLLFYLYGNICIVGTQDTQTLYENMVTEKEAVEALREIQPKDVLPLIIFANDRNWPIGPSKLKKVVTFKGRMIKGTEFWRPESAPEQMFFCPTVIQEENSEPRNCFIRQNFEKTSPLQCSTEPIPEIEYMLSVCGVGGIGKFYGVFYKICNKEENSLEDDDVYFYYICYDHKNEKVIHSGHQILAPTLLNSKLLFRERNVTYQMRDDFKILSTVGNEVSGNTKNTAQPESSSSQSSTAENSVYKMQKLVPPEDMALAIWRKTTFQRFNTAPQHEKLIDLWNEISEYIRYYAIKEYSMETKITTGIFDIHVDSELKNTKNKQLSNFWVKLVYFTPEEAMQGIAILMNNFIEIGDTEDNILKERKKEIEKYCETDLCSQYLKKKFKQVGGTVRCCAINAKITNLFTDINYEDTDDQTIPKIMRIMNITDDKETLYDASVSENQAVYSISKVQPKEVLPMVFLLHQGIVTPVLNIPTGISYVELLNRRITAGSQFTRMDHKKQIFFCPKADTKESCITPREFDQSEPLQCDEEAIPVVRKLSTTPNTCGIDDNGIIYEILYEICAQEEPSKYVNEEIKFYQFCYDASRQKVLFANHLLSSPKLLFSKLLLQEQAVEYPLIMDDAFPLSNHEEIQKVVAKMNSWDEEDEEQIVSTSTMKPSYRLQKLVPSEDMPFALWKKPTYRYTNVELQHEKLVPLWNNINFRIRRSYYKWYNSEISETKEFSNVVLAYTGVFEIKPTSEEGKNEQHLEMWVKIMYNRTETKSNAQGIAILMNNFLDSEIDQSSSSKYKLNAIDNYCEENLCKPDLQDKFNEIGGRIRCCPLTNEILQLFGRLDIYTNVKLWHLHKIINI